MQTTFENNTRGIAAALASPVNTPVSLTALVASAEVRTTAAGKPFLAMTLSDGTGSTPAPAEG
jgi:hypothetical protein